MKISLLLSLCNPKPNMQQQHDHSPIPKVKLYAVDANLQQRHDIYLPQIGFGTYKLNQESIRTFDTSKNPILQALKMGYRHIDTAFVYGRQQTEIGVGNALQYISEEIPRKDIFLTTKQWRTHHGYDATLKCLEQSLERLQTSYVDLYLIHWPGSDNMSSESNSSSKMNDNPQSMPDLRAETWRAMEDSVISGKCLSIGVSNFTIQHLETLRKTARIWPPAVNQIELHPYNIKYQKNLIEYCQQHNIIIQAYGSLGGQDAGKKTWKKLNGKLIDRIEISNVASKYESKTNAQVLLSWAVNQKFCVIPKSTDAKHMKENLEIFTKWMKIKDPLHSHENVNSSIENEGLDDEDMEIISSLNNYPSTYDIDIEDTRLCWTRDKNRMLDFD